MKIRVINSDILLWVTLKIISIRSHRWVKDAMLCLKIDLRRSKFGANRRFARVNYANFVWHEVRSKEISVRGIPIESHSGEMEFIIQRRQSFWSPFSVCCSCVRRRRGCGVPSTRHGALRYVRIIQHAYTVIQYSRIISLRSAGSRVDIARGKEREEESVAK